MKKLVALVAAIVAVLALNHTSTVVDIQPLALSKPPIPVLEIPQLECGDMLGTGFVVDSHTILTADHVVGTEQCEIRSDSVTLMHSQPHPLTVALHDSDNDFAVLTSRDPLPAPAIRINCNGLIDGETYWMVGYSLGEQNLDVHAGIAMTDYHGGRSPDGHITHHLRGIEGTIFPGMSGGPVLDHNGEVVAFVDAVTVQGEKFGLVKELADTEVCKRSDK